MVDAELTDVKENVEFLNNEVVETSNDVYDMKEEMAEWKDVVYRELDRDYYDLKDYVKHRMHRHERQEHTVAVAAEAGEAGALQMIANEYAAEEQEQEQQPPAEREYDEHVIIIDADAFMSDDEESEIQHT
jgi:hypothetical protein